MRQHLWKGPAWGALLSASAQLWASEPSSLYMRCNMSAAQYATAMAAPPGAPSAYDDWQTWFDGRGMYGPGKVAKEWLRDSDAISLGGLLEGWKGWGALSHYDEDTGRWQFALLQFTDNYGEMIQLLAPLRSVASYCKADGDSFLLVYPYIWGGGDNAYMTLTHQRSQFAKAPTKAQREEADTVLKALTDAATQ